MLRSLLHMWETQTVCQAPGPGSLGIWRVDQHMGDHSIPSLPTHPCFCTSQTKIWEVSSQRKLTFYIKEVSQSLSCSNTIVSSVRILKALFFLLLLFLFERENKNKSEGYLPTYPQCPKLDSLAARSWELISVPAEMWAVFCCLLE